MKLFVIKALSFIQNMISPKSIYTTAIIVSLVAIGPISTDMYLPAFPALMGAFNTNVNQVQYTLSIFLVGFAVAQLIYGPLSDRFGRKPVLLGAMALFFLTSLLIIQTETIESFILLRFLQAVGGSAGPVLGRAMVRDIYGPKESAKQFAYIGSAMALAPAVAPIMGGYFTIWWGWESIFIFLSVYAFISIILLASSVQETAPPGSHHVMKLGRLLGNYLTLLKHPTWPWYTLICTFVFSGLFSFLSGSSFVIIEFLGFKEEQFGLFFAIIVFGFISGALVGARLLNRFEINTLIGWGAVLAAISGSIMALLSYFEIYHIAAIIIPHMFYMAAVGLVMPQTMAGALAPFPNMVGSASAFLGFIQMSVAAIVGIIVGHSHDGTPRSMTYSIALMGLITLVMYLKLRSVSKVNLLKTEAC